MPSDPKVSFDPTSSLFLSPFFPWHCALSLAISFVEKSWKRNLLFWPSLLLLFLATNAFAPWYRSLDWVTKLPIFHPDDRLVIKESWKKRWISYFLSIFPYFPPFGHLLPAISCSMITNHHCWTTNYVTAPHWIMDHRPRTIDYHLLFGQERKKIRRRREEKKREREEFPLLFSLVFFSLYPLSLSLCQIHEPQYELEMIFLKGSEIALISVSLSIPHRPYQVSLKSIIDESCWLILVLIQAVLDNFLIQIA